MSLPRSRRATAVFRLHDEAIALLTENRERLESLAEALVRAETLDQPEAYAAAGLAAPEAEAGAPSAEPALTGAA